MSEDLELGRGQGGLSSWVFEGLWDVMFALSRSQQTWEGSVAGRKLWRSPLALWNHRGGFETPDIYVLSTHVLGARCRNLLSGLGFRLAFPS